MANKLLLVCTWHHDKNDLSTSPAEAVTDGYPLRALSSSLTAFCMRKLIKCPGKQQLVDAIVLRMLSFRIHILKYDFLRSKTLDNV